MNIEGKTSDDDFAAAFADFTSPGTTPPAAAADAPAGDPPADAPAADPPAADPPAADPPAADPPASDPPAADPPAADPPAADAPKDPPAAAPSADDILGRLADLVSKKPADAAPAPAGEAAPAEAPIYTPEETAFLEKYEADWGDVAKGEGLKRKQEYRQLLGFVFQRVAEFMQPIKETTELLAERTHFGDLSSAVPDYSDNLRQEVASWAKSQPDYLQSAYNQVITEGTVDQVKDLVARYRAETGKPAPGGAPVPPKPKDNELSGEARKAAEALAPVDVKRSGVLQPGDPSSFDDAWKQAAVDLV